MRWLLGLIIGALLIATIVAAAAVHSSAKAAVAGFPTGTAFERITSRVIVRDDDRTLVTQADDDGPVCNTVSTLRARGEKGRVGVTLSWAPPKRLPPGALCGDVGLNKTESFRLSRPIGDRPVIDLFTGRPVSVVHERDPPRISAPAGYQEQGIRGFGDQFEDNGISRTYRGAGAPSITVITGRTTATETPGDQLLGHTDITGHPATIHQVGPGVAKGPAERRILWNAYEWTIEVETISHASDLPTVRQLIDFAKTVGPPGATR